MIFVEEFKSNKRQFLESMALVIFVASLPFSVSGIQGSILLFLSVALFGLYSSGSQRHFFPEFKALPLLTPWIAYLAAGFISAALGVAPARSLAALNSDILTAISFFSLCLFLRKEICGLLTNIYLAAASASALVGVFQAAFGLLEGITIRAHSFSHRVRFGEMMVIALTLILSRLFSRERPSPVATKILFSIAGLVLAAIIFSQTRGAYLGTALAFVVLFFATPHKKALGLTSLALVIFVSALSVLNPEIRSKASSIAEGTRSAVSASIPAPDQSISTRLELWKVGIRMVKDRPVFGAGPANVKTLFPAYYKEPYPEGKLWGSLHNLYIHQAAERGLIGLAALLMLLTASLLLAYKNYRTSPSPHTLWALLLMPPWLLMNFTEISFQHVHTSYAVLFALSISIVAVKATPRQ